MAQQKECAPVYGKNAVVQLLKSGAPVDTVLLAEGLDPKTTAWLQGLARQAGAVVKRSRGEKLTALCGDEHHQGMVALAGQVAYVELEDLLAAARSKEETPFLLLADGIEDPHNLGALLRTALLCGVHGAVIPRRGAASVTPAVIKASAGAAARLPVARVANIGETIRRLKKENLFVYCADMGGSPLHTANLQGPLALVMGGEGKGVSSLVKKLCDGAICLEMAAANTGVDSYNVSVAGGILMYEALRQRRP